MSSGEDLRKAIKAISNPEGAEVYGVPCIVDSVDETAQTCDCLPINGNAAFLDVRLKAGAGNGVLMIPKEGSVVIVQPINDETGYISLFSEIESIQFLDGSYDGLIKIADLVNKINGIEDKLNDILSTLKTHTHAGVTSGASSTAPPVDFVAILPLTKTQQAEIENDIIKHGKT
jgi:hypothetical protein